MGPQDNITRVNVTSGGGVTITKASQYSFDISPTSEVQNLKVGMTAFAANVDGTSAAYGRISKVEGNRVTVSGYDGQPSSGGLAPTSFAFNAVKGTVVDGDTSSTPNTDYYNFELFDSSTVESLKIGQSVGSEFSASLRGVITAVERSSTSTKVIVKKEVPGAWDLSGGRTSNAPIGDQLFSLDGGYRESDQVGSVDVGFSATGGRVQVVDTQGVEVNDVTVLAKVPGMKSFNVGPSGDIIVNLSNGQTFISGRVLIQNFKDPNSLIRQGNNLFSGIDNAGPINGTDLSLIGNTAGEDGLGLIQSSSLEMSNVDLGQEFAEMITTQRSFQAGSRVISVSDQMLEEVVNLKR
jgi:flagellar hook-basal body protein